MKRSIKNQYQINFSSELKQSSSVIEGKQEEKSRNMNYNNPDRMEIRSKDNQSDCGYQFMDEEIFD